MIRFTKGYKYRLAEMFILYIGVYPERDINVGLITISRDGYLIIGAGYSWDGASGALHTRSIAEGALVHDVLYEILREKPDDLIMALGVEDFDEARAWADYMLKDRCINNGMWRLRAEWVYKAVRDFGYFAARCKRRVFEV